jgi:exopolysaccharide biosynthesis predicted pyruvyltransferase EpsI
MHKRTQVIDKGLFSREERCIKPSLLLLRNSSGRNSLPKAKIPMKPKSWFQCTEQDATKSFLLAFIVSACCFAVIEVGWLQVRHRTTDIRMNAIKRPLRQAKGTRMSPFDSHPPEIISLNVTSNIRHACIEEIRSNRHTFYTSYIENAAHILLVDPAYHSNVGDHMITIAELTLLTSSSTTPNASLSQCSYVQARDFVSSCDVVLRWETKNPKQVVQTLLSSTKNKTRNLHRSSNQKLALWHGGGNFGNLWPTAQQARIQSITLLLQANYTIVGMPNSWYYTNSKIEWNDMQQLRSNIIVGLGLKNSHGKIDITVTDSDLANVAKSRIVWTWREHYSYERAIQLLPYCSHKLVPDIAFQLGPYSSLQPWTQWKAALTLSHHQDSNTDRTDLVFLLRNDHESMFASVRNRQSIQRLLAGVPGAVDLSFIIVDWNDRLFRFQTDNPDDVYFTETSIQLLSIGKVLICDRLHAAILAYISDIPFIYLDQVSGKIHKTFQVAMESGPNCQRNNVFGGIRNDSSPLWSRAETLLDAIGKALNIITSETDAASPSGQQQLLTTREQRRNRIRQKLAAG